MGGMGPNYSDVPSMVLLPELLYRHAFGQPLLTRATGVDGSAEERARSWTRTTTGPCESGVGADARAEDRSHCPPERFARLRDDCRGRSRTR